MPEHPAADSSATDNTVTVKRYAPPNQRYQNDLIIRIALSKSGHILLNCRIWMCFIELIYCDIVLCIRNRSLGRRKSGGNWF